VFVTHDVDEAVLLSDRVVIFSPQPGTVRNIIDICLPRPRRYCRDRLRELKDRVMQIYQYDATGEGIEYVI